MKHLKLEPRLECALCAGIHYDTAIPFPEIPILRCRSCGFLYSGRVMPEEFLASYYKNDFGSPRHLLGQRLNADVNFAVLDSLLTSPRKISVLDVGCGYGFLLRLLADRWRARVTGVEVSICEIAHARENLGLPNITTMGELDPAKTFDLVTCLEVLEHVRNPVPFVANLLRKVAPGGHLVLMTDNFESKASRQMGCSFPKWIPHSHISHFTPASLKNCLNRAGAPHFSLYTLTPWEISVLAAKSRFSTAKFPADCFNLEAALATEMNRPFRFFALRKLLNKYWAPLALRSDGNGSLMYAVIRSSLP